MLQMPGQGVDMTRQKDDWYPTPPEATEALLQHETFDDKVWEPACGDGAISEHLKLHDYTVVSSDLNHYGYGDCGIDFLMERKRFADSIVTNPPFKLANQFISHAIDIGVKRHAWLLRLAFLEGKARHEQLFSKHPPRAIYVFSRRLTMWRGDEEARPVDGTTAYAWFVWHEGYTANPEVFWV